MPAAVVRAARTQLARLDDEAARRAPQGDLFSAPAHKELPHPAIEALRETDPDALSPKEALDLIYRLKKMSE
jgi:DNA mismatch repair protein MutS